jgi:TM2 domain-containing membrane protein YozV
MRDPVLAGILSLIVPGVGQLYNGRILAGILWLIFTPGFWLGTG